MGETESKKKLYTVLIIVLLISTLVYGLFAISFNHFGADNERFLSVFNQYTLIPNNSLLFIGDSQIREDVDCSIIEDNTKGIGCFNLGIQGILPLQIALQIDYLLETGPKVVVLGVSPLLFNEGINKNNDLFFLMNGKVGQNDFIVTLLTKDEGELLTMGPIGRWSYKRKFILPFYFSWLDTFLKPKKGREAIKNFKNPYLFTKPNTYEEMVMKVNDTNIISMFRVNNSSNREFISFEYIIKSFKRNGVDVIILKMPLNPILTGKLKDSLIFYDRYLKKISEKYNCKIADLETNFTVEEFIDLTHLNEEGRTRLSNRLIKGDPNII